MLISFCLLIKFLHLFHVDYNQTSLLETEQQRKQASEKASALEVSGLVHVGKYFDLARRNDLLLFIKFCE
jgi:hypothetical protein